MTTVAGAPLNQLERCEATTSDGPSWARIRHLCGREKNHSGYHVCRKDSYMDICPKFWTDQSTGVAKRMPDRLNYNTNYTKPAVIDKYNQLAIQHEDFKKQVLEVATRYAEANDMCKEVGNALEELGLPSPWGQKTVRINVTLDVEVKPDSDMDFNAVRDFFNDMTVVTNGDAIYFASNGTDVDPQNIVIVDRDIVSVK